MLVYKYNSDGFFLHSFFIFEFFCNLVIVQLHSVIYEQCTEWGKG